VDLITGLKLEAMGEIERARGVYGVLLKADECNVVSNIIIYNSCSPTADSQSAHQRLVALASTPTARITAILSYLDTFYSDPQAWSLLAELYAEEGAYGQSLTALGHCMVLQTFNSHFVERAAETAYTMG
jgi:hypothetical protein